MSLKFFERTICSPLPSRFGSCDIHVIVWHVLTWTSRFFSSQSLALSTSLLHVTADIIANILALLTADFRRFGWSVSAANRITFLHSTSFFCFFFVLYFHHLVFVALHDKQLLLFAQNRFCCNYIRPVGRFIIRVLYFFVVLRFISLCVCLKCKWRRTHLQTNVLRVTRNGVGKWMTHPGTNNSCKSCSNADYGAVYLIGLAATFIFYRIAAVIYRAARFARKSLQAFNAPRLLSARLASTAMSCCVVLVGRKNADGWPHRFSSSLRTCGRQLNNEAIRAAMGIRLGISLFPFLPRRLPLRLATQLSAAEKAQRSPLDQPFSNVRHAIALKTASFTLRGRRRETVCSRTRGDSQLQYPQ